MAKSGLFSPTCKFEDASIRQVAPSEHAAKSSPQAIMSASLLDAGEARADAAAAWQVLFVRLARSCTSDDCGAPLEEPVTVGNCRGFLVGRRSSPHLAS